MNIFYLDSNNTKCAKYHCDKHVIKMIVEYAQILSTVARNRLQKDLSYLYKSTHLNHPSTKWCNESFTHFTVLLDLLDKLLIEYEYRYGKKHKTENVHVVLLSLIVGKTLTIKHFDNNHMFVFPPAVVPDSCKVEHNVIESYRLLYMTEKRHLMKWTNRETPEWFK